MTKDEQLGKWVDRSKMRHMEWGTWDCVLAAVDWVKERTGLDHAALYRGSYRSKYGAYRIMKRAGGLDELVCKHIGRYLSPEHSKRGDVVMIERDNRTSMLGVDLGSHVFCVAEDRPVSIPKDVLKIVCAWRVV